MKLPGVRAAGLGVAELNAGMLASGKILWRPGSTASLQIRSGGDGQNRRVQQLAGNETGSAWLAESNGQIESVGDHVPELISGDQFQLQFGIVVEERLQLWA